jgi:hypothetical protein
VASRETCVLPNSVLAKKNSSAAKQTALHSRTPTELIGDRDNLMVNWKVDGQISTSVDTGGRNRGCSDAFVDRVVVDQDAKSKGLAQANDLFGKFDELLGIWDDKKDLFPIRESRRPSLAETAPRPKQKGKRYHHSSIRVVPLEAQRSVRTEHCRLRVAHCDHDLITCG